MADNALDSLYGKGHVNATRTRECVAMPGFREQEILTPCYLINAINEVWPEGIALDPCSEGSEWVPADEYYTLSEGHDGLAMPWWDRTYVNPPYGELKKWLAKASEYPKTLEVMLLCPVRTHRKWFRLDHWRSACLLDPVKFEGYKQAFPAPLVMLYNGRRQHTFKEVFENFGRVGRWV